MKQPKSVKFRFQNAFDIHYLALYHSNIVSFKPVFNIFFTVRDLWNMISGLDALRSVE